MGIKKLGAIITILILFAGIAYATDNQEKKVYIVSFFDGATKDIVEKYGEIDYHFKIFNAVSAQLTPEAAEQLKKEPGVKSVEEDQIIELGPVSENIKTDRLNILSESATMGDVPLSQWNLKKQGINAEATWENFGVQGEGVKIAIIDSGVHYTKDLPDLNEGYLGGHDFCPTGGGWECYYNNLEDDDPMDQYGHGTEMASAILATGNDLNGIAPKTKYYAIKITNDNRMSDFVTLLKGIEWAITNTDVDIIYMGVTGTWDVPELSNAIDNYYAKGKLFVAQDNSSNYGYPAAYPSVIGIGAHNKEEPQGLNSKNGDYVEVVAPGEEIRVLNIKGDIATAADSIGVAAAQVAGALALMIDYNRTHELGYGSSALRADLNQSALDLWPGNPKAGAGKVDVNAALTWMANDWFLEYKVDYLDPVTYDWDNNPVYWAGTPIQYKITVKNNSNINSKTITDLNVVSTQLYTNGQQVPETPEFFNVIPSLLPGETNTVGPYTFNLNSLQPGAGTFNTKIILKKERIISPYFGYSLLDKAIIKDDKSAGTFIVMDKPVPQGTCTDSDGGVDPWVFGTCTDSRGTSISDASLPANRAGSVSSGKYVLEAFCLTEQMREHCTQFNSVGYCYSLPNECYALPLIPSTALAWTYFDYNEALFCQNGSSGGVCNPCTQDWKCKDTGHRAYQNERCQWSEIKECAYGCDAGKCNACSAGWKCMDGQYRAYQSKDCGWSQVEYCSLGCESGKCRACVDSDNGVDPWVFGTCTDSRGTSISDASLPANRAGSVSSGKYVLEAFCLTDEMREHCKRYNGDDYCDNLPNECYAAPLLPSSALAWTYFDYNEALFCPNGSSGGVCNASVEGSAALGESDALVDGSALNENSIEPPLQTLSAPELEAEPEPEPAASPPAQNTGGSGDGGGGGGGGSFSSNNKKISSAESINESKDTTSAGLEENPAQSETSNGGEAIVVETESEGQNNGTMQSGENSAVQETTIEGNAKQNATGFAVLAQNALSAIIVIVAGAIALFGKLFFK